MDQETKAKVYELIAYCIQHGTDGFHFNLDAVKANGKEFGDWEVIVQRTDRENQAPFTLKRKI